MIRNLLLITLIISLTASSQDNYRKINWTSPISQINQETGENLNCLNFEKAIFTHDDMFTPIFQEVIKLSDNNNKLKITNYSFKSISAEIGKAIIPVCSSKLDYNIEYHFSKGEKFAQITIKPFRRNLLSGETEKLNSFNFSEEKNSDSQSVNKIKFSYSENSVLNKGKWLKIKIKESGIYKISFTELSSYGISDPSQISVFGNSSGQLSFINSDDKQDDLIENAIFVGEDYILFYGKSPSQWYVDSSDINDIFYNYRYHQFSDYNYYYLSEDVGQKLRIQSLEIPQEAANRIVTEFTDVEFHEENSVNLIQSGRDWFGESFNLTTEHTFNFNFPNIVNTKAVKFVCRALARSSISGSSNRIYFKEANDTITKLDFSSVIMGSYTGAYAVANSGIADFYPNSDDLTITAKYTKPTNSSEGWLDYIRLNAVRELIFTGNQMHIRDLYTEAVATVSEFRISGANSNLLLWDITDPVSPKSVSYSGNSNLSFTKECSNPSEFIIANNSFISVDEILEIENQNLHGIGEPEYLIVTHPDFMDYAEELAEIHRSNDNMNVSIVTPEQIYNEFSSGAQDVSAIRNFVKMIYDKSNFSAPRYLLLFGDGSYDNRENISGNTNFIPTYQSSNSTKPTASYVSDDFFGLLDDEEGETSGLLDIGIGRFPVQSSDEAEAILQKIKNYQKAENMGDWRNWLCFIADDEDSNIHMKQANDLATYINSEYPVFNIQKIFMDAYTQISTTEGERYPDVNDAIADRMKKGALIMNYTGHGSELGLAHEHIIGVSDIISWDNINALPLFMTATCEFSRFDDYERTSAGELVLLNPNGGGIALFTTTRLVYSTPNYVLNQNFYENVFADPDSRLGDIMQKTKIGTGSGNNKRNFGLLGDPALKLCLPEKQVLTSKINSMEIVGYTDTISALDLVNIEGTVSNSEGYIIENYNGEIYPTVFDKKQKVKTLSNDGGEQMEFYTQNNIIYKGVASVENGRFEFSFIVPRDINYNFNTGKISYYAESEDTDAYGYFDSFVIGGSTSDNTNDVIGPEISLYMNNTNFIDGGITGSSPRFLAFLNDSSGINTVGTGIGHDLTAIVDYDYSNVYSLNDYYRAEINSYQNGVVEYFFQNLEVGEHSITFKAWDVNNNSSENTISFVVESSESTRINDVYNYPNPFSESTNFIISHNQNYNSSSVTLEIYSLNGKIIRKFETFIESETYDHPPIIWDGTDHYGREVTDGMYYYRTILKSSDGNSDESFSRLVKIQ